MSVNIKIQTTDGRRLDYTTPESLNIKFNRIIDDYKQPDKRYGEFSYNFNLPKTKNNNKIFGVADAHMVYNRFKINPININVFNNDELILNGLLDVMSINDSSYVCRFYSNLTLLIDEIVDLNLKNLTTMPQIENWDYENTIQAHIASDYKNSDETDYQFPLFFYNTYFTPYSVYSGQTDFEGYEFRPDGDRPQQNFYYILNRVNTDNEWYFHQIPIAFYLKSILKNMLKQVGWSLSGSFWETDEAKQIILPYVGEQDVYDSAVYDVSGTTYLDTNKFLPDMGAVDFLNSIINTFNLYFILDTDNKIIIMETYDSMFSNTVDPFKLDKKVIENTVVTSRISDYDYSIKFVDPLNKNHLGDNYKITSDGTDAHSATYTKIDNANYDKVYNHIGSTSNSVQINFAAPKVKRMYVRNREDYDGTQTFNQEKVIFMPDMSEQTRYDNKGNKFNKGETETTVYNTEDSIKYKGKPTLYYYYGVSAGDFLQGGDKASDFFYVDFNNVKQKIPIASPFGYDTYRNLINTKLLEGNEYASYLQTIYLNMGSNFEGNYRYSLVFGDNDGMIDTLYSKFYRNKFNRYKNGEIIDASVNLTSVDWKQLQINRAILYKKELYSLMEIKNYDIVKGTANIRIIKIL